MAYDYKTNTGSYDKSNFNIADFNASGNYLVKRFDPFEKQEYYQLMGPGGVYKVDPGFVSQLTSAGIQPVDIGATADADEMSKLLPGANTSKGGGKTVSNFNDFYGQFVAPTANKRMQTEQEKQATQYNQNLATNPPPAPVDQYANDPNMVNIGTTDKPMYVPKGSAGEALAKAGFPNTAGQTSPTTTTQTGQQVYRDNNNNFFLVDGAGNKTPINLDQFHQLGINETFVKPGQTVSMQQATTGNSGTTGTTGTTGGAGTGGATGGSTGGTGTSPSLTNEQMRANLAAILPPEVIAMIPDDQLASFSAISDSFKQQFTQGTVNADIQAKDLQDAINSIANDVEFKAKYGDNLALSTANFQNTLQDLQFQTGQLQTQQQQQFGDQQKALAEQKAAMGQSYSGFREQAKERLASDQSGIIESTRQQLKNKITGLGQDWESQFGSSAALTTSVDYKNPLTGQVDTTAYKPLGNIFGTIPLSKKQE